MVLAAEPLRPRDVAAGTILATVVWDALQLIVTWYPRTVDRQPTCAAFAAVITLLSWLYLGSELTRPWSA